MSGNAKRLDRKAVLGTLVTELMRGEVVFSTGTQAALKLLRMLDDPDLHVEPVVKLIQAEPLIAARVVAVANSVAYNPARREVADVRAAVARLGFRTLRGLTAGIVARQMASGGDPRHKELAAQLWDHTTYVAALSSVLARRITRQDPETALFVGLVHEIGGFYLISRAKDFPGLLDDDPTGWGECGEADLVRAVLMVIGVPQAVVEAVATYWQGFLAMPPTTLGDTLLLADDLAPVRSPLSRTGGRHARLPGGDVAGAIYLLDGERSLQEILAESATAVDGLVAALKG